MRERLAQVFELELASFLYYEIVITPSVTSLLPEYIPQPVMNFTVCDVATVSANVEVFGTGSVW